MLTIQEAGTEILGDNPKNFYVFGGEEYGIKCKYLEHLKELYKASVEVETVSEALAIFKKKQLFPLPPKLYICRYDDSFIAELSEKTAKSLAKIKIRGTIVCLYENPKSVNKCNRYLPDNTVSFDAVNPVFIKQYLSKDFPSLPESAISEAVRVHPDYKGAYNICLSLSALSDMDLAGLTSKLANETFGYDVSATDTQLRQAFASKNLYEVTELLDNYTGDKNQIFYVWLSAMLELEKLLGNPKQKSDLKSCVKLWDLQSVYNMFMHIYHELETSRSVLSYNIDDRLLYIALLLQYQPVPSIEVM